jgi:hypothetical protein
MLCAPAAEARCSARSGPPGPAIMHDRAPAARPQALDFTGPCAGRCGMTVARWGCDEARPGLRRGARPARARAGRPCCRRRRHAAPEPRPDVDGLPAAGAGSDPRQSLRDREVGIRSRHRHPGAVPRHPGGRTGRRQRGAGEHDAAPRQRHAGHLGLRRRHRDARSPPGRHPHRARHRHGDERHAAAEEQQPRPASRDPDRGAGHAGAAHAAQRRSARVRGVGAEPVRRREAGVAALRLTEPSEPPRLPRQLPERSEPRSARQRRRRRRRRLRQLPRPRERRPARPRRTPTRRTATAMRSATSATSAQPIPGRARTRAAAPVPGSAATTATPAPPTPASPRSAVSTPTRSRSTRCSASSMRCVRPSSARRRRTCRSA